MTTAPSPNIPSLATYGRITAACLVMAVLLAVSGAFNTAPAPLLVRIGYWLLVTLPGIAIAIAAGNLLGGPLRLGERPWAMTLGIVVIVTAVHTPLVVWASHAILGGPMNGARLLAIAPAVFCVAGAMTVLSQILRGQPAHITHAAAPGAEPPKFLARIPVKLRGGELYAVEAEDHYLRLHTSKGQDLILLRLSDAVAELEGLEGAQTHRSWWVAKDAVADAERADGRAILTLKDGARAPVSRGYVKALREAGWF
jgi:hypothetical protein